MKKYHFTDEQLNAAQKLVLTMMAEADNGQSLTENMIHVLMARTTNIDATAVVQRLRRGIDTFHHLYAQSETMQTDEIIREGLNQAMEKLNTADQRMLLTRILESFARTVSEAVRMDPDADLESLREATAACLHEYGLTCLPVDAWAPLYNSSCTLREFYCQEESEAYTALAMYLLILDGTFEQISDQLAPEAIGAVTAASMEANRSMIEMAMGKIDVDVLIQVLKCIAGLLLLILVVWMSVQGMGLGALMFGDGLRLLVGVETVAGISGWLSSLLGAGIGITGLMQLTGFAALGGSGILLYAESDAVKETIGLAARKIREYRDNTLVPAAKSFFRKFSGYESNSVFCEEAESSSMEETAAPNYSEEQYVQVPAY